MKITHILLSVLCMLLGLVTIIGYFIVVLPKGISSLTEVISSLVFAVLFIVGGIMSINKNYVAVPVLVLACIVYAIVGLYQPITLYGLSGFSEIDYQFYVSLLVRVSITVILTIILHKQKVAHVRVNT